MEDKKTVYITVHKNFVKEGIEYYDKKTGELNTFNSVTLPRDTKLGDLDLSLCQFSPLFVNPSRFKGENFRDIPVLANKEIWLKRPVKGSDGKSVLDQSGKPVKETIKIMPEKLKEAIDSSRERYIASLSEKAQDARTGAREMASDRTHQNMSREDIPF